LYNESPTGAVDPTPTVGMVGLLPDVAKAVRSNFQRPGDLIALLGRPGGHLGGSLYWVIIRDFLGGAPPPCDLDAERALQRWLAAAAREGLLRSAHDCSDGGLAVALAEACFGEPYADQSLGCGVHLTAGSDTTVEGLLYGEDGARAVVSFEESAVETLRTLAETHGVPFQVIGSVGPRNGELRITVGTETLTWSTPELRRIYHDAIPRRMAK
jgi:phosphoribosylformylglycinamidine synthase